MTQAQPDADEEPRNELFAAVSLANFGIEPEGAVTFRPEDEAGRGSAWAAWLADLFEAQLAPHFLKCHRLAAISAARDVMDLDRALHRQLELEAAAAEASQRSGQRLLSASEGGKVRGALGKVAVAAEAGETPGHLATAFAVHAAAFHIPALPALLALASFEWRAAGGEGMLPPDSSALVLAARRASASLATPLSGIA